MIPKKGYQLIVLHAHLPFVRHKNYNPSFLEENWLNEAIAETYIPLLNSFRTLKRENVHFRITMSFTPTLVSMLRDSYLQNRFLQYIDSLIELSGKEVKRTTYDPHLNYLSNYYLQKFEETKKIFMDLDKDLISGFKEFVMDGSLEVITCNATHGFLPLLESEPSSIRAQITMGKKKHKNTWGIEPRGIWLAECGYFKGLENYLADQGFRYFFVDNHGIRNAVPRPKYGVYAPVEIGAGVFAFGRDMQSSSQVWSAEEGYPGDFNYREYYRDIGFDLDYEYIKNYIHPDGIRHNTGIKYHRITGQSNYKDYYHPDWAIESAGKHAEDFLKSRLSQVRKFFEEENQPAVIVSPYDAELYGHWWYEGPLFLEFLFKKIHFDQNEIATAHPLQIISQLPRIQSVEMDMSSWGEGGYADVWLNSKNEWIYPHIMECSVSMNQFAHKYFKTQVPLQRRVLNQMAREVLLLQSSDWPFILKTGTMPEYASRRIHVHCNLFIELRSMLEKDNIQEIRLKEIEDEHPIFPEIDFEIFT